MMIDDEIAGQLVHGARQAAATAYAPYSGFPVGAMALTSDGRTFAGMNIENASYGLTVCAERVAVIAAVAAGAREIVAIAVTAPKVATVTPCGACRQVLNEFKPASGDLIVILEGADGPEQVPLAELLPRSFGPRDLAG